MSTVVVGPTLMEAWEGAWQMMPGDVASGEIRRKDCVSANRPEGLRGRQPDRIVLVNEHRMATGRAVELWETLEPMVALGSRLERVAW